MKKILFTLIGLLSFSVNAMISPDDKDFYLGIEIHNFTPHTLEYKGFISKTGEVISVDPLEKINDKSLKLYVKFPPESFLEFSPKYLHPQTYEVIQDKLVIQEALMEHMRINPQNFLSFEINKELVEFSFFNLKMNYGNSQKNGYSPHSYEYKSGYNIYLISNHYCHFNSNFKEIDDIEFSLTQGILFDDLVKERKDFSINYLTTILIHEKINLEPLLFIKENIDLLIREKKEAKQKWQLSQKKLPENIKKANELTVDELEMEALYQKFVQDYRKIGKNEYALPSEINFLHKQVEENRKNRFNKFINEHEQNQKNYESIKKKVKFLKNTKKD